MSTRLVTIVYYDSSSLALKHHATHFEQHDESSRIIIPQEYKEDKIIIAVCDGEINILNRLGDRILPSEEIDISLAENTVSAFTIPEK